MERGINMNKKILGIFLVVLVIGGVMASTRFTNSVDDNHMNDEASKDEIMVTSENEEMKMDKSEEMMTEEVMEKDTEKDMMEKEVPVMNEGPMAAEFSLVDLDGNTINLKDLKGEKVYLKFWASWCSICLSGLDEIDTLSGEETGFRVLTIVAPGYNGEKNEEDFKEWFKSRATENMTVLLDNKGSITKTYGVRGYPTSVFIGSDGVVVGQFPGHIGSEQIKEIFKEIK